METNQRKLPPNPRERANLFSTLSFWWTIGIFQKGLEKTLGPGDLFSANENDSAKILGDNLAKYWRKQSKIEKYPLLKAIGLSFKSELVQLGLLHLSVHMVRAIGIPYMLGQFLVYFRQNSEIPYMTAVRRAIGLIFSVGYVVVMGNRFQANAQHLGMRIRIAVCSLIYRKTLRLSRTALSSTNPGKVINLISNDVTRLELVTINMNSIWISPLNSIFIVYFLWSEARWGCFFGIILLVLFAPIQSYFGKLTAKYRYKISIKTDERIRLMGEIISGCQVIKMYAWEKPFAKLIQFVRKLELKSVRKSNLLRINVLGMILAAPRIAIFSTIITLVLMKNPITSPTIYSIFAFYIALSTQITRYFFLAFSDVSETWVALKRLQKYMEYEEIYVADQQKSKTIKNVLNNNGKEEKEMLLTPSEELADNVVVAINNGMTRWDILIEPHLENEKFSLQNINIDFKRGTLIGIIGAVGSGKTSLLQVILRELPLTRGSMLIDGNLSYAPQEPWIFAGSVRQNILFGQKMDQQRYNTTVKNCALLADFKQFPQGDNSLVGDKGADLSGGQKARINLARAIYREADVYLLDDPLSAVDAHVGRFLFDSVIGPESYLAKMGNTRILVTHQVHFLSKADWIISMKDGAIEFQGTVTDLSHSNLSIAQQFRTNNTELKKSYHASQRSLHSENIVEGESETTPLLQNVEQLSKGKVDGSILVNFIKCGASPFQVFIFLALFITAASGVSLLDVFLSYFISREELRTSIQTNNHTAEVNNQIVNLLSSIEYLYVYTALVLVVIIVIGLRSVVASRTMTNLSRGLHDHMFNGLISSPLRFFEINPAGRILNRFSKDMGSVDEVLAKTLIDALQANLNLILVYIVIIVTYPLLAIPMTIMLIITVYLIKITLKTSNDIKRVEGITRSPVFSHMTSSITGLSTIRAFMVEKILISEFDSHQDIHSGAYFMYIYTSTAFGFALELMAFISISTIIITVLLLGSTHFQSHIIGLIVLQSFYTQEVLYLCAKHFAAVCNILMGVERLLEYKNLPAEKQPDEPKQISNIWPAQGQFKFQNVYYRYFAEGEPVLIGLNFDIKAGEKIGIVGRTGAGKSSLIGAIFRLALIEGKIFIDDIDTATILLKDLRTRISIIPQDPVLFSGTLRRNLDPFGEFDDALMWKVLGEVELKDIILSSGLESTVLTGGSNFSVGQRQLLCLARALLRNNKILILDEATANVDPETDTLIQRTIREKFRHCTVLTVAHRLHTIMDSDRVLLMSCGQIVEFGTPHELLQKSDGAFRQMVESTGESESERLKSIVSQQYL